mgnify:FL=1
MSHFRNSRTSNKGTSLLSGPCIKQTRQQRKILSPTIHNGKKNFQKFFLLRNVPRGLKRVENMFWKISIFCNFCNFHPFSTFFKIPKITRSRPTDPPITPTGHPSWSPWGRLVSIHHGFPNFVPPVYPLKFFCQYKTISRKLTEGATTLKFFLLPPETSLNESCENQRSISITFENFRKNTVWPFSQFPWKFQI